MIDLSAQCVLVTGGNRGIGAACCRLFARAGADVVVHYRRRKEDAEALLEELRGLGSGRFAACAADLADEGQVEELFTFVAERWQRLDGLVLNAGIWERNSIRELSAARLERTWRVNVAGVFSCLHQALPLLERSASASVVTVSSTAGQRGEAFYSAYAASKGAIIAATKSWASELAPAVRVNCVAPGWVDTEMAAEALAGEVGETIAAGIPLGRVASPEDIAGPVLFLSSPLARHITGEILNVNGGAVLVG